MAGTTASTAGGPSSATVFDLLETLPRISLDRLYGLGGSTKGASASASSNPYPWTCRAVFQSLPPLAKQYVMRLLCVEGAVTKACLESWVEPGPRGQEAHRRAIRRLDRLRILQADEDDPTKQALNPHFRTNLRAALASHEASPWSGDPALALKPDKDPKTPTQLESYMCAKWNGVLHFLVGSADTAGFDEPAEEVQRFLRDTGLMAVPSDGLGGRGGGDEDWLEEDDDDDDDNNGGGRGRGRRGRLRITNAGVDFLLKDVHVQVWRFVEYVISHEEAARDDILTFLFQLSYCRVGQAYPVAALTPAQRTLLGKFTSFGLIYQRSEASSRFYPTAVAVNLIFGATSLQQRAGLGLVERGTGPAGGAAAGAATTTVPKELRLVDPNQLAIIVETNYQVVAYTASSLHLEMLRIFADVRCRLPNAVIGFITRASVRRAMASGITARTILSFLKGHAHPAVRARKGRLLPENVEAQIELWHQERARVKFEEVMMVDLSKLDEEDFEETCAYASELGVSAWRTPARAEAADEAEMDEEGSDDEDGRPRRKKLLAVRAEGLDRIRTFVEDRALMR